MVSSCRLSFGTLPQETNCMEVGVLPNIWGRFVCTVHSMQEVEPATNTKVSTCNVRTHETFRSEKGGNLECRIYRLTHPGTKYAVRGEVSAGDHTRIPETWGLTSGVP